MWTHQVQTIIFIFTIWFDFDFVILYCHVCAIDFVTACHVFWLQSSAINLYESIGFVRHSEREVGRYVSAETVRGSTAQPLVVSVYEYRFDMSSPVALTYFAATTDINSGRMLSAPPSPIPPLYSPPSSQLSSQTSFFQANRPVPLGAADAPVAVSPPRLGSNHAPDSPALSTPQRVQRILARIQTLGSGAKLASPLQSRFKDRGSGGVAARLDLDSPLTKAQLLRRGGGTSHVAIVDNHYHVNQAFAYVSKYEFLFFVVAFCCAIIDVFLVTLELPSLVTVSCLRFSLVIFPLQYIFFATALVLDGASKTRNSKPPVSFVCTSSYYFGKYCTQVGGPVEWTCHASIRWKNICASDFTAATGARNGCRRSTCQCSGHCLTSRLGSDWGPQDSVRFSLV